MTTVRAKHYPQPPPSGEVLAEAGAGYCEHDGVPARCPMCRAATELVADTTSGQDATDAGGGDQQGDPGGQEPTEARPVQPQAAGDDPRATPWWQR
jgi:hypothetical protein